jgi:hypothetical protein
MPLEPKMKKVILAKVQKAMDDMQRSSFDGFKKLMRHMTAFADLVSDKNWKKELKMIAVVMGGVGATTESQFEEDVPKAKKDEIFKSYTEILTHFQKAFEDEDIKKIDDALKNLATVFIDEVT